MMKHFLMTSVMLSAALTGSQMSQATEIIAHRGYSAIAPENTMASMRAAWKVNTNGVECDVYLTKDKQIIVSHDGNTKRTTGESYEIASTDTKTLQSLDAGSFKGAEYKGEKLPLLSDLLKEMPANTRVFIEIKCGPEITPYIKKVVKNSKKVKQVTFISFNKESLAAIKKAMPANPAYILLGHRKDQATKAELPYGEWEIQLAKDNKWEGLDLAYPGVSEEFVKQVHDAGLKIYTWTLDDSIKAVDQTKMGVDGITTNEPVKLMTELQKNKLYPEK